MKKLGVTIVVLLLPAILWAADESNDLQIRVREVIDERTTKQFFNFLVIELNVVGELVRDVKGFHIHIHHARDDLGTDLVKAEEKSGFIKLRNFTDIDEQPYFRVYLKNPSRHAKYVKEFSGTLELFIPKNDENSVVTIQNIQQQTGSAIRSKILEQAGVELIMFTQESEEDFSHAAFPDFGMLRLSEHSIVCTFKDPHLRVLDMKFFDPNGYEMDVGRGKKRSNDILIILFADLDAPPTIGKIYLKTDKAMVKVPFQLTDIALP